MTEMMLLPRDIALQGRTGIEYFDSPFTSFGVRNYFPEKIYAQLCEEFPDDSLFTRRLLEGKRFFDKPTLASVLESRPTWQSFIRAFQSQEFLDDVFEYLKPGLKVARGISGQRRWKLAEEHEGSFFGPTIPIIPRYEFSLLEPGACLTPHTDKMIKLANILFYFPPTDWKPEYGGGTDLYTPKDKSKRTNWMNRHLPFDDMDVIGSSLYEPNSAFCFVKSADSWHGVRPLTQPVGMFRRSFNLSLTIPKAAFTGFFFRGLSSFRRRRESLNFRDVPDMKEADLQKRKDQFRELFAKGLSDEDVAKEAGVDIRIVERFKNDL